MWYSFLFEAKGIQPYILAGGRLRHMVGASAIVDDLCAQGSGSAPGLLDRVLQASGVSGALFLRRAGGAFSFALESDAAPDPAAGIPAPLLAFHRLWTFAVQRTAPGLPFVDALGKGATISDALADARALLAGRRSFPAFSLPLASPLVLRAQRTGEAAVDGTLDDDLDAGLLAKERKRAGIKTGKSPLSERFIAKSSASDWPQDMESQFPFLGEDRTVAIFHADGNRMGEFVINLGNRLSDKNVAGADYAQHFKDFSDGVDSATTAAARKASESLGKLRSDTAKFYPARPILCAGDDITVILRADIALDFARTFLLEFETQCAPLVDEIASKVGTGVDPFPPLTACGALVYCNASQPFMDVHRLAESACKFAKEKAKSFASGPTDRVPSCLTIHRITGSLIDDYEDILAGELTLRLPDGREQHLTANPYLARSEPGIAMPTIEELETLAQEIGDDIGRGVYREIASLIYLGEAEALTKLRRIEERVIRNKMLAAGWQDFRDALNAVLEHFGEPPKRAISLFSDGRTPINDAVMLHQTRRRASAT